MRSGDAIAARISADGATWTHLGVARGTFPSNALIGAATSSGTQSALSTAVISQISASPFTESDVDLDGLADTWEMTHFTTTAQDGTTDSDGDGINDLHEYLAGTNPTSTSSAFRITGTPVLQPGNQIQLQWQAVASKTYRITTSTTLTGTWIPIATGIPATVPTTTQTVPTSGTRQFYRVEVENPGP
jgi:hypothetical protein